MLRGSGYAVPASIWKFVLLGLVRLGLAMQVFGGLDSWPPGRADGSKQGTRLGIGG
jgi:hypothetical protein